MKSCGIIVTYNPNIEQFSDYLYENIKQLDFIFIVDNSDDVSIKARLNSFKCLRRLEIISLESNLGIAHAQNLGIRKFLEDTKYEFVLFLDQDSKLPCGAIDLYLKYYEKLKYRYKVGCLGVGSINISTSNQKGILEVEQILSSGSFVSRDAINAVGLMDSELFIDFVDYDWCWRAVEKGYKIFSIKEMKLLHSEGERVIYFSRKKIVLPSPLRHYYQYRNFLFLLTKKYVPFRWKIKMLVKMVIKVPFYLIFIKKRMTRIKYILEGIADFLQNRKGKYLYN